MISLSKQFTGNDHALDLQTPKDPLRRKAAVKIIEGVFGLFFQMRLDIVKCSNGF